MLEVPLQSHRVKVIGGTSPRINKWALGVLAASVSCFVALLCHQPAHLRLDFHIYVDAIRHGARGSIYDYRDLSLGLGFTYPPFAAWCMAAFTRRLGEVAWFLTTVASLVAFYWLSVRITLRAAGNEIGITAVTIAIGLWLMPAYLTARLGQINGVVALFVIVDALLLTRRSELAGILTGVATALKLTPALVIVTLMFCGYRRFGIRAIASFAVAATIGYVFYTTDSVRYWTTVLWDTGRVGGVGSGYSNSLRRFVTWLPISHGLQLAAWVSLCLGLVAVLVVTARRLTRIGRPGDAVVAAVCAGYLVSPITWGHHLLFCAPAGLLIVGDGRSRRRRALAVAFLLPFFDYLELGEGPYLSAIRALALVAFIVGMFASTHPRRVPADGDPERWTGVESPHPACAIAPVQQLDACPQ